jgi:hypothetical protein
MPPAGEPGLAAASPIYLPEVIPLAQSAMSHVQPMVVGPATDRDHLRRAEEVGSAAIGFRSSAAKHYVAFSVASTKNKGISVVVDTQNSPSPTMVT